MARGWSPRGVNWVTSRNSPIAKLGLTFPQAKRLCAQGMSWPFSRPHKPHWQGLASSYDECRQTSRAGAEVALQKSKRARGLRVAFGNRLRAFRFIASPVAGRQIAPPVAGTCGPMTQSDFMLES